MTGPYHFVQGGHPPQTDLLTSRAMFTQAYAVIPKGVMRDIVTSAFPFWNKTRGWVLARPLSGFAETFSQTIMEVAPGGGSDKPETHAEAEAVLFVTTGELDLQMATIFGFNSSYVAQLHEQVLTLVNARLAKAVSLA